MRRILPIVLLAACSDPSSPAAADAVATGDAYDTARCLIEGSYGDAGALTGTAGDLQGTTTITATLDPGPPRDTFFIKLVPGSGVFAAGVAPGTYTISGADADYNNCGLCVHIIADITNQGPSKFYFADAGTVTLMSTTPPIMGSAEDLHFNEIDIGSGQPVNGGCEATMGAVAFTAQ